MPDETSSTANASARHSPQILIVDDDVTTLMLMSEALQSAGYAVVQASDGVEALARFRASMPDLVLLDIEMPEMDGFSVCAEMRRSASRDRLPIVMVTGLDDAGSIQSAFRAGATDFIIKPINWPLFSYRVDSVLATAGVSAELVSTRKHIESLQRAHPDTALVVTRDGSVCERLGAPSEDRGAGKASAESLFDLWPEPIAAAMVQRVRRVLKTRATTYFEFELPREGGSRFFDASFLIDSRHSVLMVVQEVGMRTTGTEAYQLAYFDPVTKLPNSNRFYKDAAACIADAALREHRLALLRFEFDLLDEINKSLDSSAKEDVLRTIAQRLMTLLEPDEDGTYQRADGDAARFIVTRLSANGFAILATQIASREGARQLAERVRGVFAAPVDVNAEATRISPIIGVALFPEDGADAEALMRAAEAAMQEAHVGDKSRPCLYSDLGRSGHDRIDRAAELRWALEQEQLKLYYQPRIAVGTGAVAGVEALLRWEHPLRGFVPLSELMPLAEATGLIRTIGEWVIETVCRDLASCREPGGELLKASIHLSSQEFLRPDLAVELERIIERTGMSVERLELELTERTLVHARHPAEALQALTRLGVGLMLDNFGTGYSSLAVLRDFPIDALKIDKSFIERLTESRKDAAICEVIVGTAHKLGLRAVAEGVETEQQADFLRRHGCDEMQGFLIAAPGPLADLERFLSRQASEAESA